MARPESLGIFSQIHDRQLGLALPSTVIKAARGSKDFVKRLGKWRVLTGHDGCVNTIAWNSSGDTILSGSDDCHLKIYHVGRNKLLESIRSGHRANIFSARFLPSTSDKKIVSCCGAGMIYYNEIGIDSYYGQNYFNCHAGTTYELTVIPGDPNSFLTCGEDGTVRHYDLRVKANCFCQECKDDILIERQNAITSVDVNPMSPYHLAVGCEDSFVRIYDMRAIGTRRDRNRTFKSRRSQTGLLTCFKPPNLKQASCRVTSLRYDEYGENVLVSYCSDYVYLFSLDNRSKMPQNHVKSAANVVTRKEDDDASKRLPPMKRLRLRGDWSDTGPNARPENEQENREQDSSSLMQRISDVFSRWLEESFNDGMNQGTTNLQESDEAEEEEQSEVRGGAEDSTMGVDESIVSSDPLLLDYSDDTATPQGLEESSEGCKENGVSCNQDVVADYIDTIESPVVDLELNLTRSSDETKNRTDLTASSVSVEKVDCASQGKADERCFEGNEISVSNNNERCECKTLQREISAGREANSMNVLRDKVFNPTIDLPTARNKSPIHSCDQCSSAVGDSSTLTCFGNRSTDVRLNADSNISCKGNHTVCSSCSTESNFDNIHCECIGNRDSPNIVTNEFMDSSNVRCQEGPSISGKFPSVFVSPIVDNSEELTVTKVQKESESNGISGNFENDLISMANSSTVGSLVVNARNLTSLDAEGESGSASGSASETLESTFTGQTPAEPLHPYISEAPSHLGDSAVRRRHAAATRIQRCFRLQKKNTVSYDDYTEYEDDFIVPNPLVCFKGHRNARTMIKEANFFGEDYVLSGSDCGRVFIWNRFSGELVGLLEGDRHVVNCVQPHPYDPIVATSGIDYNIKVWAPILPEPATLTDVDEIIYRNEQMLEESRDTITVPASFMLRMLASLSRVRGHRRRQQAEEADEASDDDINEAE